MWLSVGTGKIIFKKRIRKYQKKMFMRGTPKLFHGHYDHKFVIEDDHEEKDD